MLTNLIEGIKDSPDSGNFSTGNIEKETIENIENNLSIRFPNEYKGFISEFGSGKIGYINFYGVKKGLDVYLNTPPNIIFINNDLINLGLNSSLLVVAYAGDQEYFVLNCNDKNYGKVYVWNPSLKDESIEELELISDNFESFVKMAYDEKL